MMSYVLIAIVVCVILFAKMALVIIPQSETKIVERLGRYYATLKPGINIIIPFIDRAKSIVVLNHGRYQYSTTIDLREQVYDFPKQNVITKDNVQTEINALLYFQIVDPFKATYEIIISKKVVSIHRVSLALTSLKCANANCISVSKLL